MFTNTKVFNSILINFSNKTICSLILFKGLFNQNIVKSWLKRLSLEYKLNFLKDYKAKEYKVSGVLSEIIVINVYGQGGVGWRWWFLAKVENRIVSAFETFVDVDVFLNL